MCFEAGIARMVRQGNVQEAASELGQRMTASSKASARQKNLLAICRAEMGDFIGPEIYSMRRSPKRPKT